MPAKTGYLGVRMDPEVLARLRALAEARDTTIGRLVRLCVDAHLPTLEQDPRP